MTNTQFGSADGDHVVRIRGARMRAQARSVATVIRVDGRIDWSNIDAVFGNLRRFIALGSPLIVDVGAADVVACETVDGFVTFDLDCLVADVPWLLVADARSSAGRLLDAADDHTGLPVVHSVTAAIAHFVEHIQRRRHFVTGVAGARLCG